MPMGIVDDSAFESEIKSLIDTPIHKPTIPPSYDILPSSPPSDPNTSNTRDSNTRGRKEGDVNVPHGLRSLIAVTAVNEGREAALQLGREFGISPSSVSAYSNGVNSTKDYNNPNGPIKNVVDKAKRKISIKARKKLHLALEQLTENKLMASNAKEVAGVAKDMAVIMKAMDPPEDSSVKTINNSPTFMIYAPQMKAESEYPVIHSRE